MKKYFVPLLLFLPLIAWGQTFDRDLYFGMRGNDEVSKLQELLTDQGFYAGPITGNFFSLTLSAVKKFQAAHGITPVSGYFGPKAQAKANAALASAGISESSITTEQGTPTPVSVVPPKTTDDVVSSLLEQIKLLQQQLAALQQSQQTLQQSQQTLSSQAAVIQSIQQEQKTQTEHITQQTQTIQQIQQNTTPPPPPPIPPPPPPAIPVFPPTPPADTAPPQFTSAPTLVHTDAEFRLVFTSNEPVVFVPKSQNPTDGAGNCLSVYTTPCSFRIDRFAQFCGAGFALDKSFVCPLAIRDMSGNRTETAVSFRENSPLLTPAPHLLIGHWMFDEGNGLNVNDSSGNANNGILVNANPVSVWTTGKFGKAVVFDGQNDYLEIPHSVSLDVGMSTESYTVSLWFKKDGNPREDRRIIGKNDGYGLYPFNERILSNGRVSFTVYDRTTFPTITSTKSVTDGSWHHIVGIRDATNDVIKIYIDGKEDATPVVDTTIGSIRNNDVLWADRYETSGTYHYTDFALDDVHIYSWALKPIEILQLYNVQ